MRIFITALLCLGSWYLGIVLMSEFEKYQFVYSDNSWIEAAQRMHWFLWMLSILTLLFAPFGIMPLRHGITKETKALDKELSALEKAIEDIKNDLK